MSSFNPSRRRARKIKAADRALRRIYASAHAGMLDKRAERPSYEHAQRTLVREGVAFGPHSREVAQRVVQRASSRRKAASTVEERPVCEPVENS